MTTLLLIILALVVLGVIAAGRATDNEMMRIVRERNKD